MRRLFDGVSFWLVLGILGMALFLTWPRLRIDDRRPLGRPMSHAEILRIRELLRVRGYHPWPSR
jgi:hypothetical protein